MKKYLLILSLVLLLNNQEILRVINQYRGLNHLPALKTSQALNKTAEYKVNDMIKNNYFAHSGFYNTLIKFKVKFTIAGDNLAKGYTNEKELVNDWMVSPTHRANILDKNFKSVGVFNKNGLTALHLTN